MISEDARHEMEQNIFNLAHEEGLFELDEWEHPELKECLLKKIENF